MKNLSVSQNEAAWNEHVHKKNRWTIPVTPAEIADARQGVFSVLLTAQKPVPKDWFPHPLAGTKILCLASGGGQQGPILAAAGAEVTVFDLSAAQLGQDSLVAEREQLSLKLVKGDMQDLSAFSNEAFDLVFCPVSVTYIPQVQTVFAEVYRILKKGGQFLFGSVNPFIYIFDGEGWENNLLRVANKLPFCSFDELNPEETSRFLAEKRAVEYSHTLQDLIGGQTQVGFQITGFYEDDDGDLISRYSAKYFATRAVK